ncbi:putative alcohol dehydrogenase zinc-binding domain protein [Mycobacterium xenopi 3993]|nr:putative alcohol dehydrogenase zinc-binding domain protein [Mycobacterium xenopi 3993]
MIGTTFVGAFAEQALLRTESVTLVPDGVDYATAASFGVTYRTAYHALRSVAQVAQGDWVVVLGAAGGVGLAAVDLAVAMKARVLAAASSRRSSTCAAGAALRRSSTTTAKISNSGFGTSPVAVPKWCSILWADHIPSRRCAGSLVAAGSSRSATPRARFPLFR